MSPIAVALVLTLAAALTGCGASASTRSDPSSASRTPTVAPPAASTRTVARAPRRRGDFVSTRPQAATVSARVRAARSVPRPAIVWNPIPFGPARTAQMTAYVRRHYGSFLRPTWRLTNPHVIVIHYTDSSYNSTYNTFAADVPDSELHELPATSAHFVIDTSGVIHQLVSLGTMARHTVGLNWTAIGIEHVGYSDGQVLGDGAQIGASLRLVHWLRCRFQIPVSDVIGHAESLSSPYHHEDVPSLRAQTHGDFIHADMQIYRRRLRALGSC